MLRPKCKRAQLQSDGTRIKALSPLRRFGQVLKLFKDFRIETKDACTSPSKSKRTHHLKQQN